MQVQQCERLKRTTGISPMSVALCRVELHIFIHLHGCNGHLIGTVACHRVLEGQNWVQAHLLHLSKRHRSSVQTITCVTFVNMPCPSSAPAVVTMTDPSAKMLTTAGRGGTMLLNLIRQRADTLSIAILGISRDSVVGTGIH